MKVSIALATYNGERYLQSQLESFTMQARQPDEVIACDDGSSDRTIEILSAYAREVPFPVKIFSNEKNLGYAQNFAKAISLCSGDIIFLSDQDDQWHSNKISAMENCFLEKSELQACFSNSNLTDNRLLPIGQSLFQSVHFSSSEQAAYRQGKGWQIALRKNVIAGNTLAFRSSAREKLLPIPPGLIHDEWIASLLSFIGEITFIEEPLLGYRQHDAQNIGVIAGSFFSKWKARLHRAKSTNSQRVSQQILLWQEILQRLTTSFQTEEMPAKKWKNIREKIDWLRWRKMLPSPLFLRFILLCLHLSAYRKYENSWRSALKDLVAPPW